ncbi:nucleotidyltransferase domain-containing protein [Effusibacillus consociatus]|uniref:Nucleotidyltransferase domain-containing protein n=1 Tax=Effusibacillus consociatus TaxID=1117041 RepID=A0ABV9PXY6_9BACL
MFIKEHLREQLIKAFSAQSEVLRVTLFGSRARGDADERSDIDLAIEAPQLNQRQWLELLISLEQIDTLLSMDVIRWEEAPPELKKKITQEGKVLYERI